MKNTKQVQRILHLAELLRTQYIRTKQLAGVGAGHHTWLLLAHSLLRLHFAEEQCGKTREMILWQMAHMTCDKLPMCSLLNRFALCYAMVCYGGLVIFDGKRTTKHWTRNLGRWFWQKLVSFFFMSLWRHFKLIQCIQFQAFRLNKLDMWHKKRFPNYYFIFFKNFRNGD